MPDKKEVLQYPVILVHGVAIHDRKGLLEPWGRIPKVLKQYGVNVFLGNTDAWGDYESNAEILKGTIGKILETTNREKVNIIAHSKGGIDSRYLIWRYGFGAKIASLTTLSTPHHGSEIADLIYKQKIIHTRHGRKIIEVFSKLYGDKNPNMYNVTYQLTTGHMKGFNEKVKPDPRVYYQNFCVLMNNAFDDLKFFVTYNFLKGISGKNDGVVSKASADWEKGAVEIWGVSHDEIIDRKRKKISGMDIPSIYIDMVNKLAEKGF
ncbi:MAG: hypothetical protein LBQ44_05805 [Treponema sp.]|jgi:triacylglycerol lipase|nr:hypothetical protein [Treponema sp.]